MRGIDACQRGAGVVGQPGGEVLALDVLVEVDEGQDGEGDDGRWLDGADAPHRKDADRDHRKQDDRGDRDGRRLSSSRRGRLRDCFGDRDVDDGRQCGGGGRLCGGVPSTGAMKR